MRTWLYEVNPFLNACENSFRNAIRLSIYHDSALLTIKDDPFFAGLYSSFHPLHVNLLEAYTQWKVLSGDQQGNTLELKQYLQELAHRKIQSWDIKIQSLYPQYTPEYVQLLPWRRFPFQSGSQLKRINAVRNLLLTVDNDPALAPLKTEIETFHLQVEEAYKKQKTSIIAIKGGSIAVEEARVAMCVAQFGNLGLLIHKFAAEPKRIGDFFDLQAIRNPHQVFFRGKLKGGKVRTLAKHTFKEDDQVFLRNKGTVPLQFYLSHYKDRIPDGHSLTLEPGEQIVPAKSLGKLEDLYLMVHNPDANYTGEFEVELL